MKLIFATALAVLFAVPALAQSRNCDPREKMLEVLTTGFGETRQSRGISKDGELMEMFANIDTGSWTATLTDTNGRMCIMSVGWSYEQMNEEQPTGAPT